MYDKNEPLMLKTAAYREEFIHGNFPTVHWYTEFNRKKKHFGFDMY